MTCQTQHRNWLQLRVRHQRSIRKLHRQFPIHQIPSTTLPTETAGPAVTVPDCQVPEKKEAEHISVGKWPQPTEVRRWKIRFTKRSLPEPLCYGLVKLRVRKVLTISSFLHLSPENQYQTSRILISRLQADSGKFLQGTAKSKSPLPKVIPNSRSDHSREEKVLGWSTISSKLVAIKKPSWTLEIDRKFN